MPVYSDYSLYPSLSPSSYSSYLLSTNRSTSGYTSSGYSSGNYFSSGSRSRYSPLLPTISEGGLSPNISRRGLRASPVSYTSNVYSPRTTPSYHVPKPVNVNTENIDVSTPRKVPSRISENNDNSRSTIKRGRTVVRIHTKRNSNNEEKIRVRMTPGERLKEKYLLKESEWDRKKRKDIEESKLKELEKEESAKRLAKLMCLECPPIILPELIPTESHEIPRPDLLPDDDLDITPKNSSDESDTENTDSDATCKKKRKHGSRRSSVASTTDSSSRRSSVASIPEEDLIQPRTRRKSDQIDDFDRRDTLKHKLGSISATGGINKKKGTCKKQNKNKLIPVVTSGDNSETVKAPRLYIENIVVEEERIIMLRAPPKCRNKKKKSVIKVSKLAQGIQKSASNTKLTDIKEAKKSNTDTQSHEIGQRIEGSVEKIDTIKNKETKIENGDKICDKIAIESKEISTIEIEISRNVDSYSKNKDDDIKTKSSTETSDIDKRKGEPKPKLTELKTPKKPISTPKNKSDETELKNAKKINATPKTPTKEQILEKNYAIKHEPTSPKNKNIEQPKSSFTDSNVTQIQPTDTENKENEALETKESEIKTVKNKDIDASAISSPVTQKVETKPLKKKIKEVSNVIAPSNVAKKPIIRDIAPKPMKIEEIKTEDSDVKLDRQGSCKDSDDEAPSRQDTVKRHPELKEKETPAVTDKQKNKATQNEAQVSSKKLETEKVPKTKEPQSPNTEKSKLAEPNVEPKSPKKKEISSTTPVAINIKPTSPNKIVKELIEAKSPKDKLMDVAATKESETDMTSVSLSEPTEKPIKWNRRDSRMDWEWPDDKRETVKKQTKHKETPTKELEKEQLNKTQQISLEAQKLADKFNKETDGETKTPEKIISRAADTEKLPTLKDELKKIDEAVKRSDAPASPKISPGLQKLKYPKEKEPKNIEKLPLISPTISVGPKKLKSPKDEEPKSTEIIPPTSPTISVGPQKLKSPKNEEPKSNEILPPTSPKISVGLQKLKCVKDEEPKSTEIIPPISPKISIGPQKLKSKDEEHKNTEILLSPKTGVQNDTSFDNASEPIKWNRRESRMDWVWPDEDSTPNRVETIKRQPKLKINKNKTKELTKEVSDLMKCESAIETQPIGVVNTQETKVKSKDLENVSVSEILQPSKEEPKSPKTKVENKKCEQKCSKSLEVESPKLTKDEIANSPMIQACSASHSEPAEEPIKWNRRESRMDWVWPDEEEVPPPTKLPPKKPALVTIEKKPKIKKKPEPLTLTDTLLESPKNSPKSTDSKQSSPANNEKNERVEVKAEQGLEHQNKQKSPTGKNDLDDKISKINASLNSTANKSDANKNNLDDKLSKINAFLTPKSEHTDVILRKIDEPLRNKSNEVDNTIEQIKITKDDNKVSVDDKLAKINAFLAPARQENAKEKVSSLDDKLTKINEFLSPKSPVKTETNKCNVKEKNLHKKEETKSDVNKTNTIDKQETLDDKLSKINAFLAPKSSNSETSKADDSKTNKGTELDEKLSKINAFLAPKPSYIETSKVDETKANKSTVLDEKLSKINAFLAPKSSHIETSKDESKASKQTDLDEKLSKINAFLKPTTPCTESPVKSTEPEKKASDLDEKLSKINSFLALRTTNTATSSATVKTDAQENKNTTLDDKISKINAIVEQPSKETESKVASKAADVDDKLSKINAWLAPKPKIENKKNIKTEEQSTTTEVKKSDLDDKLSKINAWLTPKPESEDKTEKIIGDKITSNEPKKSELDDKLNKINAWLAPKTEIDKKLETSNEKTKVEEKSKPINENKSNVSESNKPNLDEKLSKINAWLAPKVEEKLERPTANTKKAEPTNEPKSSAVADKQGHSSDCVQPNPEPAAVTQKVEKSNNEKVITKVGEIKTEPKINKNNLKVTKPPAEKIKTKEKITEAQKDIVVETDETKAEASSLSRDESQATIKAKGIVKYNKITDKVENSIPISPTKTKQDDEKGLVTKKSGKKLKDKSDETKTETKVKRKAIKKEEIVETETENKVEEKAATKKNYTAIDVKREETEKSATLKDSTRNEEETEVKAEHASKQKSKIKKKSAVKDNKSKDTKKQSNKKGEIMNKTEVPAPSDEKPKNKYNFPAPSKPLFMNNPLIKNLLKNREEPVIKPLRRFKEIVPPAPQPVETARQVKVDRISTARHMALKQSSPAESESSSEEEEDDDDDDDETSSEDENQSKPDRTSTSSEDSGFGSTHTSPLTNKHECSVNCHRKCEKHMPNLCGVNQKLLAEALSSLKKGRTNPGSTKHAGESREGASPARRLSTTLSSDSESGEEGAARRYTPPARTIPRFRKYTVDDFQFLKVLGKGSFGKVLLAELRSTDCYYAVKCLKKDVVLEDDDVECTLIERKVLALGTRHPYLCHLFCTFQTDSHLFFVMEYLNGGDLMFHIQQSGRFEQSRACFYAAEIVSGLKFLHKKGIVYRDLKLDNILLDYEGHVRIADFGMCKLQIYLDRTADTFCGTPDYMAPEIIKGLHYNQCVDWWSFGVLLYEMLIGQSPFNGCDEDELFWSICNETPYYPRFLSKESQSILTLLLDKDSSRRLGTPDCPAGDVFMHPFFKSIDWAALDRKELEPPFKPRVLHALDVQYFDTAFTQEAARLTPVDKEILQSMDQSQFHGFSYTNPNACNE